MCKYTIAFERPWAFAFLALAALLIFLPYFMTPRNKRVSVGRILSLVARSAMVTVAVFLLAGTTFTEVSTEARPTSIVLVLDTSDSDGNVYSDMLDYANGLIDRAEEGTEFSTVWFADSVIDATDFTADRAAAKADLQRQLSRDARYDATNLAGALRYAAGLFPEKSQNNKRVILLSDGRETAGNAFYAAQLLTEQGIRLDAVPFDVTSSDYAEVALTDFAVTPKRVLRQGESLTMQAVIYSTVDTQITLTFYDGNSVIKKLNLAINVGENQFSQAYTPEMLDGRLKEPGVHEFRARVTALDESADNVTKNNRMYTWARVTPTAKLLLVDGDGTQAEAVKPRIDDQYSRIDVCAPATFPETMKELLQYDEIALLNVNLSQMPADASRLISLYVGVLGRGLLTSAGSTEQSYLSYTGTALEDLLPLTITLDETEHNVAMVIVIDDSYSMKDTGVDRFAPAKEGAKKIVNVLSETDYVGVVTFHQDASRWDRGMVKVTDPEELCRSIDLLECKRDNTGTSYDAALTEAIAMISGVEDVKFRHVIFLTDGEPTDSNYQKLPEIMKNEHGITLTTVALRASEKAKSILSQMALNGGGEFRSIDTDGDLDSLSTIMEDLAKQIKEPQFVNQEPFTLRAQSSTGLLNNVKKIQNLMLNGYIGSTLKKSQAQMSVSNDDFRPVVAEQKYGAGYVVAFMSDFGGGWCTPLFEDTTGDGTTLIRNLFRQALNEQVDATSITVATSQSDRTANLSCETGFRLEGQTVTVYVSETGTIGIDEIEGGNAGEGIDLVRFGSAYRGAYETQEPNRLFYLTVVVTGEDGAIYDYVYTGFSGGPIAEYRLFENDGTALLNGITGMAGGAVMQDPAAVMSVQPPDTFTTVTRAYLPLMLTIGILLLADILCRTVTFEKKRRY